MSLLTLRSAWLLGLALGFPALPSAASRAAGPLRLHPFNPANNLQAPKVEGADALSGRVHARRSPEVNAFQAAYVRKVVDTLNDLDNVLYEVINEGGEQDWNGWVIQTLQDYERTQPKQHPVGSTGHGAERLPTLLASPGEEYLVYQPAIGSDPSKSANSGATATLAVLPQGHVFFQADFEGTNALHGWTGTGLLETGHRSPKALAVELRQGASTPSQVLSVALPGEAMRGYLIRGAARVRAEAVGPKPNPWNGIKCMLALETPDRRLWPQAEIATGTFDWRRVAFTVRVPTNATAARLVLGLEQVNGKAWFDDVTVAVVKPPVRREPKPGVGQPFTGHNLPRLRGAMISPDIDAAGLRVLGREWNANLLRWQLIRRGRAGQPSTLEDYDAWLEGELKKLDTALPLCREHGLYVVVDLHSPPGGKGTSGGYVGSDDRLFTDPACQAKFVQIWQRIAARYQGAQPIWGYDLVNEPVEDLVAEECDDWQGLAERAARAIRAIDPARAIIVEPAAWGGPSGLSELVPLPVSNVVYSVHMYLPHAFTHQGVYGSGPHYHYPGPIEGKHWDKTQLEAALQPVIDFQRTYGVHIYIGEFSAIRWAPDNSAYRYLKDLIEVFEAHGWDWSYHAFREWSGWSVEHGSDRNHTAPAPVPTDRQRLLQHWLGQNQKPVWP